MSEASSGAKYARLRNASSCCDRGDHSLAVRGWRRAQEPTCVVGVGIDMTQSAENVGGRIKRRIEHISIDDALPSARRIS